MKKEELKELIREIIKEELYKKNTENEKEILIKKKKQKPINKEIIYYVTELGDNPNKRELGIYFGENNLLKRKFDKHKIKCGNTFLEFLIVLKATTKEL